MSSELTPVSSRAPRPVDVVIISDCHLGTPQCRAQTLLSYLQSVQPRRLVINGDLFDLTMGAGRHYNDLQQQVIERLLHLASTAQIDYVTGNHDIALRRFHHLIPSVINLTESLDLLIAGRKYLVMHGDQFDHISESHWSHLIGSSCYDSAMLIDSGCAALWRTIHSWCGKPNAPRRTLGLVNTLRSLPAVQRHVARFHQAAAHYAADHGYDGICCGHVHTVVDEVFIAGGGKAVHYLNSGDWCRQTTALECHHSTWSIIDASQPQPAISQQSPPALSQQPPPALSQQPPPQTAPPTSATVKAKVKVKVAAASRR